MRRCRRCTCRAACAPARGPRGPGCPRRCRTSLAISPSQFRSAGGTGGAGGSRRASRARSWSCACSAWPLPPRDGDLVAAGPDRAAPCRSSVSAMMTSLSLARPTPKPTTVVVARLDHGDAAARVGRARASRRPCTAARARRWSTTHDDVVRRLITRATPTISSPSAGLANRRPARVDSSRCGASAKRRPKPRLLTATASVPLGASARGRATAPPTIRSPSRELEQLLHRLAVAGGRRHVVDAHDVGVAEVGEERRPAPWSSRRSTASTASPSRRRVGRRSFTSRTRLIQPSRGQDRRRVLVDDEVLGVELDLLAAAPPILVRRLSAKRVADLVELARARRSSSLRLSLEDAPRSRLASRALLLRAPRGSRWISSCASL